MAACRMAWVSQHKCQQIPQRRLSFRISLSSQCHWSHAFNSRLLDGDVKHVDQGWQCLFFFTQKPSVECAFSPIIILQGGPGYASSPFISLWENNNYYSVAILTGGHHRSIHIITICFGGWNNMFVGFLPFFSFVWRVTAAKEPTSIRLTRHFCLWRVPHYTNPFMWHQKWHFCGSELNFSPVHSIYHGHIIMTLFFIAW